MIHERTNDGLRVTPDFRRRLKSIESTGECWWNRKTSLWCVYEKVSPGTVDLAQWSRMRDNGLVVMKDSDYYRFVAAYQGCDERMIEDLRRRRRSVLTDSDVVEQGVKASEAAEAAEKRELDNKIDELSDVGYDALKRDVGDENMAMVPRVARDQAYVRSPAAIRTEAMAGPMPEDVRAP